MTDRFYEDTNQTDVQEFVNVFSHDKLSTTAVPVHCILVVFIDEKTNHSIGF